MMYFDPRASRPVSQTSASGEPATVAAVATLPAPARPASPTVATVATVATSLILKSPSERSEADRDERIEEEILCALEGRELSTVEVAMAVRLPLQSVYSPLGRLLAAKRIATDPARNTYFLTRSAARTRPNEAPREDQDDPRAHEDALAQGKAEHAILDLLAAGGSPSIEEVLSLVRIESASTQWALDDLLALGLVDLQAGRIHLGNRKSLRWGDERSVPFRLPGWDPGTEPPGWV